MNGHKPNPNLIEFEAGFKNFPFVLDKISIISAKINLYSQLNRDSIKNWTIEPANIYTSIISYDQLELE